MTEQVTPTTDTILYPIMELLKVPGEILNMFTQYLGFNFTDLPQPIQILVIMFIAVWIIRKLRILFYFDWMYDIRLPKRESLKTHKTKKLSFTDKFMIFFGLAKVKEVK